VRQDFNIFIQACRKQFKSGEGVPPQKLFDKQKKKKARERKIIAD
jgi:hypothetical protein